MNLDTSDTSDQKLLISGKIKWSCFKELDTSSVDASSLTACGKCHDLPPTSSTPVNWHTLIPTIHIVRKHNCSDTVCNTIGDKSIVVDPWDPGDGTGGTWSKPADRSGGLYFSDV